MQRFPWKGPLIIIFAILSLELFAAPLPDVKVTNEFGQNSTLSSHLEDESLIVMGFYQCRHICHFVAKNLAQKLSTFKSYPKVIFFGIDENEGPRHALNLQKRIVGPQKSRWSFLVADKKNIDELVKHLNFDMSRDPVSGVITHEMGLYAVKNGEVINKISDIVVEEKDLKFDKTSGHLDGLKKFCSEFDPRKSKYGQLIVNSLTAACVVFMVLALFGFRYLRRRP